MTNPAAPQARSGFKIAIVCAVPVEAESVRAVFDKCWEDEGREYGKAAGDKNTYTTGVIGHHNVVLVLLPSMGSVPAAQATASLGSSFPKIELVLVVGVCGVAPRNPDTGEEIILGDVIISTAVTQYNFGRTYPSGFQRKTSIQDSLRKAPKEIQGFINKLGMRQTRQKLIGDLAQFVGSIEFQRDEPSAIYPGVAQDHLYDATYLHQHRPPTRCEACYDGRDAVCSALCDELGCEIEKCITRQRLQRPQQPIPEIHPDGGPRIHLGRIGSADTVMKSGLYRDTLVAEEKLIAFEMEGAGVWDEYPTIVIKGACDYADSHKNKVWQPYAAMMAAGCLKAVLAKWVMSDELADIDTPRSLGLCFSSAPLIQPNEFVGRTKEIDAIHDILRPEEHTSEQRRVVLGGIGGIGKTQLAIVYARRYAQSYASVLWLNASSELSLGMSLQSVARVTNMVGPLERLEDDQVLACVRAWLAHARNTRWLLIFDNYDNPDQFSLGSFYPDVGHGSIIITTRLPDKVTGAQLRLQPLTTTTDGLDILQIRSGRENVKDDAGAHRLVARMAGLPLALATAGAYLRRSTLSFQKYFEFYEERWQIDLYQPLQLKEYQNRTLYTTWDLSYSQLKLENTEAAQMLKLLAYFDNQEVWHELFLAGLPYHPSSGLLKLIADEIGFASVMGILVDYGLVEVHHARQSYGLHSCVHDWTLGALNQEVNPQLYWYAFDCVATLIETHDWDELKQVRYARVSRHGVRLVNRRFQLLDWFDPGLMERLDNARKVANMLGCQMQFSPAEQLYERALAGYEKVFGSEHPSTFYIVSNLGLFYTDWEKLMEAERMCERALASCEKVLGPEHASTLTTVLNLGNLYSKQGKTTEAERMYERALAGYEKVLGPEHRLTLSTVHNLGSLYSNQGKITEAERMYQRALAGDEKGLGLEHPSTLDTVYNLGNLYSKQGKLMEAERMYQRALAGKEKVLGLEHASTLNTVHNFGDLYSKQGKITEAERMFERALAGYEKGLGLEHPSTLDTVHNLGNIYSDQGKMMEAERMYQRALAGKEKVLGLEHPSTLETVHNLGSLYSNQGKMMEAERMYQRALAGKEKVLGLEHASTLDTVYNFGNLYFSQGKIMEAERVYQRALAGYEKVLGPEHLSTLNTVNNLGYLYSTQGKSIEAERMYKRALASCEKTLGHNHPSTQRALQNLNDLYDTQSQSEGVRSEPLSQEGNNVQSTSSSVTTVIAMEAISPVKVERKRNHWKQRFFPK